MAHVSHYFSDRLDCYMQVSFILKMSNIRRRRFSIAERVKTIERLKSGVSNKDFR